MPVELPELDPPGAEPKPPHPMVWMILFVVIMVADGAVALLTWPKGEPTDTAWFWVRLLGLPALTWCAMFGLRLHYYDQACQRRQSERGVRADDREKRLRFAREPLAVLDYAYLAEPGRADVARKIAGGELALSARTTLAGVDAIRHTALELTEDPEAPERYRTCFNALLEKMSDAVAAVPNEVPLIVRLQLPDDLNQEGLLQTWQSCWAAKNARPVSAELLCVEQGAMFLDEWLDICGGPALERATLLVSVQLHDKPTPSSAEAAVGMLFAWAPLAERYGLKTRALLHRPVETEVSGPDAALSKALMWGETTADEISDLWQSGLSATEKRALLQAASDMKLGISQTAGLLGVHDIDLAIGHPGVCGGWLDIVLGIEHAVHTGTPQLMAWHEQTLRFAVARVPRTN